MKKLSLIMMFLCAWLMIIQCSKQPSGPGNPGGDPGDNPGQLSQTSVEVAERSNTFGLKLFKEIVDEEDDSNIFISPLSVSLALGMTLNGANGETEEAMEQTLGFTGLTEQEINESYRELIDFLFGLDPDVTFEIANSIWTRQGFPVLEDFFDVNRTYFDAETRELDFNDPKSVDTINGWVDEKTNGKISEVLREISPMAVMYLINALYFKGAWTTEFDSTNTRDVPFHLSDGSTTRCKMMYREEESELYFRGDDFQAVELPYGNGDYSMVVMLPDSGVALDDLIGRFSDENWSAWMASFDSTEIELGIPKFQLEYKLKMNDVLTALGMGIAFSPGMADFSGINPCMCLFISFVLHKTFVEVTEIGTEAAAVTVVGIEYTSVGPTKPRFYADRPFVFAIRERCSGSILFMGKIVKPKFE